MLSDLPRSSGYRTHIPSLSITLAFLKAWDASGTTDSIAFVIKVSSSSLSKTSNCQRKFSRLYDRFNMTINRMGDLESIDWSAR